MTDTPTPAVPGAMAMSEDAVSFFITLVGRQGEGRAAMVCVDLVTAEYVVAELTHLRAQVREGEKALEVATNALEFYADPAGCTDEQGNKVSVPDFYSELDFDGVANAALGVLYALKRSTPQPAPTGSET